MKEKFILLENNLNREIDLYKELVDLFKEKQEILVSKDSEKLINIDVLIQNKAETIQELINTRIEIMHSISPKAEITMSDIISECEKQDNNLAKILIRQKDEVNSLVATLADLEKINIELTKYGIKVTNKVLQIILNNITIPSTEYDKKGNTVNQQDIPLSSVNEEV